MQIEQEQFQQLEDPDIIEIQSSIIRPTKYEQVKPKKIQQKYIVTISQSDVKNPNDINLLENQYYYIKIMKGKQEYRNDLCRRFSDFDFLFQLLFKKYPGIIFPGFPATGIVSYVKTKVSITKDHEYLINRMKMVERFINKILNNPVIKIDQCQQLSKFLSNNKDQFQLFKKTQKARNNTWAIANSWKKLVNYFYNPKNDHKYKTFEQELTQLKKQFEIFHCRVRQFLGLLKQELQANKKIEQCQFKLSGFDDFKNKLIEQSKNESKYVEQLQNLNFQLFCENEDIIMAFNTLKNREQLKQQETNYKKYAETDSLFNQQQKTFNQEKNTIKMKLKTQFVSQLKHIQQIGNQWTI